MLKELPFCYNTAKGVAFSANIYGIVEATKANELVI